MDYVGVTGFLFSGVGWGYGGCLFAPYRPADRRFCGGSLAVVFGGGKGLVLGMFTGMCRGAGYGYRGR